MLTLTEAADELGLAASTLRHQVQAGRLRARLVGKTYVVSPREIERLPARASRASPAALAIDPLRRPAGEVLPALDRDLDVLRVDLHRVAAAAERARRR